MHGLARRRDEVMDETWDGDAQERRDRLELLALISAGLAHDMNGPLAALSLQASALARDLRTLERVTVEAHGPLARTVESAFERCAYGLESLEEVSRFLVRMVRDLSRFSRGRDPVVPAGGCDLRHAVEQALRLAHGLTDGRATLETLLPEDVSVLISESALVRVLLNLVQNAAQAFTAASPAQNRVRIAARRIEAGIVLDVIDNATGIGPEARAHVFEPFASAKLDARSAGLGLSVARALVREAGGELELHDSGPHGTTMRCRLPTR